MERKERGEEGVVAYRGNEGIQQALYKQVSVNSRSSCGPHTYTS